MKQRDIVIVGGGLAGLSLARELAPSGRNIEIIEPRTAYKRDRTWCFWAPHANPWATLASHHWRSWTIKTQTRTITRTASQYPYHQITAEHFYDTTLNDLKMHSNVALSLGRSVTSLQETSDHVTVHTDTQPVQAARVFDSRPQPHAPKARLLQHFAGWSIRTEHDAFDPTCATLMDFSVDQSNGVHFIYVLPTSSKEALVEDTYFSAARLSASHYKRGIRSWLTKNVTSDYAVTHQEHGVLPMEERLPPFNGEAKVVPIGLAAGAARPSTGYAFLTIQRHSKAIAEAIDRGAPIPRPHKPRMLLQDAMFLSVIRNQPHRAPDIFIGLFADTEPDQLARFLSEQSSLKDEARVMLAGPGRPLLREGLRAASKWRQAWSR